MAVSSTAMANTDSGSGQSSNNTSSVLSSIVSSYQDRSDSCSNPSLIQSMLRNTTETGDIGLFSITPGSLAFGSPSSSKPDRAKSRASSTTSRYPRTPRERMESKFYTHDGTAHPHTPLRGSLGAETFSLYRAGTPHSQYTRASSLQNGSQITLSDLRSPSQADLALLPRPGRHRQQRPCILSHLGSDLDPHESPSPRSILAPGSPNPQRFPRAASIGSDHSQDSFVTSVTNTTDQQPGRSSRALTNTPNQQPDKTIRPRASMTYYDYSENFGGSTKACKANMRHVSAPSRSHHGHVAGTKDSMRRSRNAEKGALRRAQTSMVVHLDGTPDNENPRHDNKGTLAEWEQLGISSRLMHKKKSPGRHDDSGTADNKESAGLPVPVFDGCESPHTLLNEVPASGAGVRSPDPSEVQLEEARESEKPSAEIPFHLDSGIKSSQLSKGAKEAVSSISPRKNYSPDLAKPKIIKIDALANIAVQSPRPERPISFRNPNDRLSRILSIDESFSDENDPTKLFGKHARDASVLRSVENYTQNPTEKNENTSGNVESQTDSSEAEPPDVHGVFWRLRQHFNKTQSPRAGNADNEGGKKSGGSPTKGQTRDNEPAIATRTENTRPTRRGRSSRKHTDLIISIPEENNAQASRHPTEHQELNDGFPGRQATTACDPKDRGDQCNKEQRLEVKLSRVPEKSSQKDLGILSISNNESRRPHAGDPVSRGSADFVFSTSEAREVQTNRKRSSVSDTAPRIHLDPPTPSLGLEDVGSMLSGLDSQEPTNHSSAIIDADVIGTRSTITDRPQGQSSRRWTRVSSYFTSNQSTVGSGETPGMTWIQFTSWKLREQIKECKRAGLKCLGKRKEERGSIGFEMH